MTKDEIIEGFACAHFGALPPACVSYARELLSVCLVSDNYAEAIRELYAVCGWHDQCISTNKQYLRNESYLDLRE